ncbi:mechanosensitive ion channel family protein [Actinoplanes sp. CA-051413]|uniref:mechanosensitive ion channel family protein n=1 Tax=Actinoplanes sp. CA-051413 TaxID=3239899 RepID=UPI003D997FC6
MSGADLSDALSDMWRSVLLFVPTALAFLAILLIGYVLARLVRTVVVKTLRRIGFDRAVERGAIGKALGGRVEPSDLCAKIAFYAVLLFALQLAFGIWGPNAVSDLLTALIGWLPRAFVAIVIIVVAAAIGGAVRDLIGSALGGLAYGRVLAQVAYWLIVALGVIAALEQVQIATAVTQPVLIAVLATVAGVVIVGVGGGLIRPMQRRWEVWLERASAESAAIREHARSYADERARVEAEKKAAEEEASRKAAALAAEQARLAEQARVEEAERRKREDAAAEAARAEAVEAEARAAEAAALAAEEAARAAEEAARERAAAAAAAEKTQVIPMQRPWPGSDDRPHVVPGFDDPEPVETAETTTWLHRDAAGQPEDGTDTASHAAGQAEEDADAGSSGSRPEDGTDTAARSDDARGVGEKPGEDTSGAVSASAAGSPQVAGESEPKSAAAGEADPDRPAESADATSGEAPAKDSDGADASGSGDDDAETTADVTGRPGGTGADSDSTVVISRNELRQALPQQSTPADGEKTQVIRVRRDDKPNS